MAYMILAAVFFVLFVITTVALIFVSVFALRYGKMVLGWEKNINHSLDMLSESYREITKISQMPLFVDTPEVRRLLTEISKCREAVLYTANAISNPEKPFELD